MKCLASVFCPGRMLERWCRFRWRAAPPSWGEVQGIDGWDRQKRVAVGWELKEDSHSLGKRVTSSAGPGEGQLQERQEELP